MQVGVRSGSSSPAEVSAARGNSTRRCPDRHETLTGYPVGIVMVRRSELRGGSLFGTFSLALTSSARRVSRRSFEGEVPAFDRGHELQ
jgi:hypothetical protein